MMSIADGEGAGKTFLLRSIPRQLQFWIQSLKNPSLPPYEDREAALKVSFETC